jgi:hypothetical protein
VEDVAVQIVQALRAGTRRRQLGWPEKLFAWLNGAFPALVDRGLRAALPVVRVHAAAGQQTSPRTKSFTAAPTAAPVALAFDRRVASTPTRTTIQPAVEVAGPTPGPRASVPDQASELRQG